MPATGSSSKGAPKMQRNVSLFGSRAAVAAHEKAIKAARSSTKSSPRSAIKPLAKRASSATARPGGKATSGGIQRRDPKGRFA